MKIRVNRTALYAICIFTILCIGSVFASQLLHAQTDSADSQIVKKLDEILANQKTFTQDIAFIKEELRIIKIRITQQQ